VTPADALTLAKREESHFFDRKALAVKPRKIEKIAVAFSNADGGEFIIGIADDKDQPDPNSRWQGAKDIEDLNAHLQSLFNLDPPLDLRFEILRCENYPRYCLLVRVEKSSKVCKTSEDVVYVRYGAQSLRSKITSGYSS